jgi:hypothetical protein
MIVAVEPIAVVLVSDNLGIYSRLRVLSMLPGLLKCTSRLHRNVNEREAGDDTTILVVKLVAGILEPGDDLQTSARTIQSQLAPYSVVDIAVHRRVEVGTRLVDTTVFTVEEPKQRLDFVAVRRIVHWNVVVTPSDLFDGPIYRLCSEGQLLVVTAFDVPPHVRSHGARTAGLGVIIIAERYGEGKIVSDDWSHDLIDDTMELLWAHELAGDQIAVEHNQFRLFVVENQVHHANSLDIFALAGSYVMSA